MQDAETWVFLHEDVIDQVGRLLCRGNILGILRHELHNLLGPGKDAQQRRKHRQDSVADLGQNDPAAALFLVPKLLAEVIGHRPLALRREIAVDVSLAVSDSLED